MASLENQVAALAAASAALTERANQLLQMGMDKNAIATLITTELQAANSPTAKAISDAVNAAVSNSQNLNTLVTQTINNAITNNTLQINLDHLLAKAGGVLTGRLDLLNYTTKKVDLGAASGAVAFNLAEGNSFRTTVNGTTSYSFTNVPAGTVVSGFVLEITNGGNFTITWPATVKWPGGVAPVLTNSGTDVLTFVTYDNGATWRGLRAIADSK